MIQHLKSDFNVADLQDLPADTKTKEIMLQNNGNEKYKGFGDIVKE